MSERNVLPRVQLPRRRRRDLGERQVAARRDRSRLLHHLVDRERHRRAAHRRASGCRTSRSRRAPPRCRRSAARRRRGRRRGGRRRSGRTRCRGPARAGDVLDRTTTRPLRSDGDVGALEHAARALDVQRDAGADDDPVRRRGARARRSRARGRQAALVVARVVGQPERRSGSGKSRTRLRRRSCTGAIPSRPRGVVDEALDEVVALGPPRPAVRAGRNLVRPRARRPRPPRRARRSSRP